MNSPEIVVDITGVYYLWTVELYGRKASFKAEKNYFDRLSVDVKKMVVKRELIAVHSRILNEIISVE